MEGAIGGRAGSAGTILSSVPAHSGGCNFNTMGTKTMHKEDRLERRKTARYAATADTLVNFFPQGPDTTGFLLNMSPAGAAFEYIMRDSPLPDIHQIDVFLSSEEFHIRRLPCRIVYDREAEGEVHEPVIWRRAGIRFGLMSSAQKSKLIHLINHYWQHPTPLSAPSTGHGENVPGLMDDEDIFLSRLKLLIIAAKAYLKGYPFGEYRKTAVSRNADEIIKHLSRQTADPLEKDRSPLFREHILTLSNAFLAMPIKSCSKADIQSSIAFISEELAEDPAFGKMPFLKVA